jgi:hypothetical protein
METLGLRRPVSREMGRKLREGTVGLWPTVVGKEMGVGGKNLKAGESDNKEVGAEKGRLVL